MSGWVWLLVVLGVVGYLYIQGKQRQAVPVPSRPPAYNSQLPYSPPLNPAQGNAAVAGDQGNVAAQRASQTQNKKPRTVEQCLRLKSDAAMARCLEKAPQEPDPHLAQQLAMHRRAKKSHLQPGYVRLARNELDCQVQESVHCRHLRVCPS